MCEMMKSDVRESESVASAGSESSGGSGVCSDSYGEADSSVGCK